MEQDRKSVDVLFLGLSKAFDKVPYVYLLEKLKIVGIDGSLSSYMHDYLTNRRQRCIITSGVPQGTILGPLLILLYINHIADNLTSKVALFADNCVLFREVQIKGDQSELQNDLTNITKCSNWWQMTYNPEKCEVLELVITYTMVRSFLLLRSINTLGYSLASNTLHCVLRK